MGTPDEYQEPADLITSAIIEYHDTADHTKTDRGLAEHIIVFLDRHEHCVIPWDQIDGG